MANCFDLCLPKEAFLCDCVHQCRTLVPPSACARRPVCQQRAQSPHTPPLGQGDSPGGSQAQSGSRWDHPQRSGPQQERPGRCLEEVNTQLGRDSELPRYRSALQRPMRDKFRSKAEDARCPQISSFFTVTAVTLICQMDKQDHHRSHISLNFQKSFPIIRNWCALMIQDCYCGCEETSP